MAMLKVGITVSRYKKVQTVLTALAMLVPVACHGNQGAEAIKSMAEQSVDAETSAPTLQSENHSARAVGKVVISKRIDDASAATISVRYLAGQDAVCELQISEGQRLVVANSNMIECGLLLSPEMVDVEITGSADDLEVVQQKGKQTSTYSLQQTDTGQWVVKKVAFTRTQDNSQTGETDVIRETADLSKGNFQMPVSEYDYASIESYLVESIVR